MITWGILATMTAAVVGEKSFFAIVFLLGMAEGRSLFHLLAPEELPRAGDSRDALGGRNGKPLGLASRPTQIQPLSCGDNRRSSSAACALNESLRKKIGAPRY
jgi:hypothetical protein